MLHDLRQSTNSKFTLVNVRELRHQRSRGKRKLVRLEPISSAKVVTLFVCLLLSACRSKPSEAKPSIEFTKIPAAQLGGPEKVDAIEGRVSGAHAGQQIVLYAKAGDLWWVQPFRERPFTQIESDSRWKGTTHPGTEYAALLVEPGYAPPDTAAVPPSSAGVVCVGVVKGTGTAPQPVPPKLIEFSGYEWTVRSSSSFRGGSENDFNSSNAWVDANGALHLRIAKNQGKWTSAEVKLNRSLGYGTYAFTVRDASQLEPSAVLTLYTWDDTGTEQKRSELDIEISRWGYRRNDNAQYVVQPYYIPTNVFPFTVPGGEATYSYHWAPGEATFSTTMGSNAAGERVVSKHVFTSGVPAAGGDAVHMNLYVFGTGEIPLTRDAEIVIEKFVYLP